MGDFDCCKDGKCDDFIKQVADGMSEAMTHKFDTPAFYGTPPIPPGLCGIQSCVFTPHTNTAHSWATTGPRIYTTDLNGVGIRREADGADVDALVAGGRKVFTTKGETA